MKKLIINRRIKVILLIICGVIALFIIISNIVNNIRLSKFTEEVKRVREIKDYDFTTMGKSLRDRIYEKYDTVKFGHYTQDISGVLKEPIDWIVIERKNGKALLLSKYILDLKEFNDEKSENITWENCTLRKWLNKDFYNKAFSNSEKKRIIKVINQNENSVGDIEQSTEDKVFILSEKEIREYFDNGYIYDSDMKNIDRINKMKEIGPLRADKEYSWEEFKFHSDNSWPESFDNATTKLTDYLKRKLFLLAFGEGLLFMYNYVVGNEDGGSFSYWFRTICDYSLAGCTEIQHINSSYGSITSDMANNSLMGVRPAIWVSLD